MKSYLTAGKSFDEAVALAEQDIENEINGKYSDDLISFDLVILDKKQNGNVYEITIDPVYIDLKY